MPKNRDYTNLVRTPSSMAWLIGQRSRVKGAIEKLEKVLGQAPLQIERHKEELRALDAVIPLHEVEVDAASIVGTRPKRKNALPRGTLKRHILNFLRTAQKPLYTDEIALHIARIENIDLESFPRVRFTRLISYRLKDLHSQGLLTRHHERKTSNLGRWSMRDPLDD